MLCEYTQSPGMKIDLLHVHERLHLHREELRHSIFVGVQLLLEQLFPLAVMVMAVAVSVAMAVPVDKCSDVQVVAVLLRLFLEDFLDLGASGWDNIHNEAWLSSENCG
jgi:hypothetical protein